MSKQAVLLLLFLWWHLHFIYCCATFFRSFVRSFGCLKIAIPLYLHCMTFCACGACKSISISVMCGICLRLSMPSLKWQAAHAHRLDEWVSVCVRLAFKLLTLRIFATAIYKPDGVRLYVNCAWGKTFYDQMNWQSKGGNHQMAIFKLEAPEWASEPFIQHFQFRIECMDLNLDGTF